ncbi:MAG: alanine--tRNA ligase [Candidatus Sungbacteria bacterium]|nr:alanine--tRNA ligase [Candidatus Sungbacteria bacterium]
MNANEIRKKFLDFWEKRGHAIIPSASLVPEGDITTLFTGSGMQPLIKYLLGEAHPKGVRLANSQKSFRAEDIDEVGDNRHTTFFEMLGNWSLGDYFKEEQLSWFFEFLTDEVGLDPQKLYVTVFAGDPGNNVPRDDESVAIWKRLFQEKGIEAKDVELITEERGGELGMQSGRIFYYQNKNWWSRAGAPASMPPHEPGGPDSEVFYEFTDVPHDSKFGKFCHPNCDCGRFMEIGNSVFMEYVKKEDGTFEKLAQQNVDFGGGLERIAAASRDDPDMFNIDLLRPLMEVLHFTDTNRRHKRIIVDHTRASAFLLADGVRPSNKGAGYILRRLMRRIFTYESIYKLLPHLSNAIIRNIVNIYKEFYPEVLGEQEIILAEFKKERETFTRAFKRGLDELKKRYPGPQAQEVVRGKPSNPFVVNQHVGKEAADIHQTYGLPVEIIREYLRYNFYGFDEKEFSEEVEESFRKHQEISRAGAERKFGGHGLILDTGELKAANEDELKMVTRLHTATHLLNAALRKVLGDTVEQNGSDINALRTRFDFNFPRKLTDEEIKRVEELVNYAIQKDFPMTIETMPLEDAKRTGALYMQRSKYPDPVKVYTAGNFEEIFSKELCGGPHVTHTGEIGHFKIVKEESSSAGVRRIRATVS